MLCVFADIQLNQNLLSVTKKLLKWKNMKTVHHLQGGPERKPRFILLFYSY